jgi:hypothetical protein
MSTKPPKTSKKEWVDLIDALQESGHYGMEFPYGNCVFFPKLNMLVPRHDNCPVMVFRHDGRWYRKPHRNGALQYDERSIDIERLWQQFITDKIILGDEGVATLKQFEDWDEKQGHHRRGGGADNLRARLKKNRLARKKRA